LGAKHLTWSTEGEKASEKRRRIHFTVEGLFDVVGLGELQKKGGGKPGDRGAGEYLAEVQEGQREFKTDRDVEWGNGCWLRTKGRDQLDPCSRGLSLKDRGCQI